MALFNSQFDLMPQAPNLAGPKLSIRLVLSVNWSIFVSSRDICGRLYYRNPQEMHQSLIEEIFVPHFYQIGFSRGKEEKPLRNPPSLASPQG